MGTLALSMKALLCQEMFLLHPTVPPIPFHEQVTCPDFFTLCSSSKGDILDPNLKSQYNTDRLPDLVKRILVIILKPIAYCTEFITKWRQLRLDVILCPMLGPAFNHGYAGKIFGNVP
ncbi:hypothetical protein DV515_00004775 [Chloebia gouldiae]|uniref:Uncharacterized protein n=1 Tax=Chloebia gouldiae TaxID=44316 RepID=A0A3L8SS86_CHLGU|nr:hypothetical protein DV515_00004775 [Chloebia gouldiae]